MIEREVEHKITIKIKNGKDVIFCNNLLAFQMIWGATTAISDLNWSNPPRPKRITRRNDGSYAVLKSALQERLDFLKRRKIKGDQAIKLIEEILNDTKN